ncbi:hypothetical protein [Chryseobacterium sp. JAH]|nr:hypothetical protein [Chryseobacterium sp. JAH]
MENGKISGTMDMDLGVTSQVLANDKKAPTNVRASILITNFHRSEN